MDQKPMEFTAAAARYGKADLHIHTRLSDGGPTAEQVVKHVIGRTDLDVIAITDHNCIEGGLRVRDLARRQGLGVIVGEEVSTSEGHLLALFIEQTIAPGRTMAETIAEVHEQGGLAIAAHPYDIISQGLLARSTRAWSMEELEGLQLDGLETLNASLVRHVANVRAGLLAQRLGLTALGSSDAHHLAVIGRAYTYFPGHTPEDLRWAVLTGMAGAGGQSWRLRQYLSWVSGCLIPRALHRAHGLVRAYGG